MKKFGQFNGSLRIFLDCICVIKSGGFDQNMGNGKFETSGGMLPRKTGCNLILHSRAEYIF